MDIADDIINSMELETHDEDTNGMILAMQFAILTKLMNIADNIISSIESAITNPLPPHNSSKIHGLNSDPSEN